MNTSKHIVAIAALALVASAFAPAAAIASTSAQDVLIQKKVSYADLDLSREAGARTLYLRIRNAAASVCAGFIGREYLGKMNQTTCIRGAVERAVVQVDKPTLTQYFIARYPHSVIATSIAAKR